MALTFAPTKAIRYKEVRGTGCKVVALRYDAHRRQFIATTTDSAAKRWLIALFQQKQVPYREH